MGGIKRKQVRGEDVERDVIEGEDDAENSSADEEESRQKMRRIAEAAQEDEDDDEQEGEGDYEEEEEEDEGVENMATQEQFSQNSQIPVNLQSHAEEADFKSGRLKKILCTNFMCHETMVVELGPDINFITGPNGSGKSAIITALQTCFGMSAQATQRSNKMSGLIRQGSTEDALVQVSLYNDGPNAYRPEAFGSTIVIERIIKLNGGSSYSLKNGDTMREVSKKKNELKRILNKFNITVENPSCILDQETSKKFLKGDGKKKYKIFMEASFLEWLKQQYQSEKEARKKAEASLRQQKELTKSRKAKIKEKEAQKKEYQRAFDLESEHERLIKQKSMVLAKQAKDDADEKLHALEKRKAKLDAKEKAMQEYRDEASKVEENLENLKFKVEERKRPLNDFMAHMHEIASRMDLEKKSLKEIQSKQMRCESTIKGHKNSIREYTAELNTLNEREAQKDQRKQQLLEKHQNDLKAVQEQLDKIEQETQLNRDQKNRLADIVEKLEQEEGELKARVREIEQSFEEAKQEVKRLREVQRDAKSRFGGEVSRILEIIEKNLAQFSEPPKHVGLSVQLSEKFMPHWKPVEHHLRNSVRLFLLNTKEDQRVLERLCRAAKIHTPNMWISRFRGKRYEVRRPDLSGFEGRAFLFMDILEIADADVFNMLVDSAQIESTVLVPDSRDARRLTFQKATNGPGSAMPTNMTSCLDRDGHQYSVRNGSDFRQAFMGKVTHSPQFFTATVSPDAVNKKERDAKRLEAQFQQAKRDLERKSKDLHHSTQDLQNLTQNETNLYTSSVHLQASQRQMESRGLGDDLDDDDVDREAIQTQIQDARTEISALEATLEGLQQEQKHLKEKLSTYQTKWEEAREAATSIENEISEIQDEYTRMYQQARSDMGRNVNMERKVEKLRRDVGDYTNLYEDAARTAQDAMTEALKVCGGVEVDTEGKTLSSVDKEIQLVRKSLEKEKKRLGSNEAIILEIRRIEVELKREKKELEETKAALKRNMDILHKFKKANEKREKRWDQFLSSAQHRMGVLFRKCLSHRSYNGQLHFDQNEKELRMSWWKTSNGPESQVDTSAASKDVGQLSGGEKSFTGLAFLLSLGQISDCPFRVMDEFDVFMDESNRKTSLQLVIKFARSNKKLHPKQYIFITPHDISQVDNGDDIKKFRMAPPSKDTGSRFAQTTLNFQNSSSSSS